MKKTIVCHQVGRYPCRSPRRRSKHTATDYFRTRRWDGRAPCSSAPPLPVLHRKPSLHMKQKTMPPPLKQTPHDTRHEPRGTSINKNENGWFLLCFSPTYSIGNDQIPLVPTLLLRCLLANASFSRRKVQVPLNRSLR